ncbi:MAG: universal stress protein [Bryobacteraceae bacterium]
MLPFRKILFPVDYSEPCRSAVPHVMAMMDHYKAELSLIHSYGLGPVAYNELMVADPLMPQKINSVEEKRLRTFASEHFPDHEVEIFVEQGEAGTVIHNFVQHQGTDLVMVPAQGHGPWRRLLLGSVTTKVLHDVSAAVWTATASGLTSPPVYHSIVVALDDSDEAEAVLKAAELFARPFGANLFLVHAVELPSLALELDVGPYRQTILDSANAKLAELKAKLGVDAPHRVTDEIMMDGIRHEALRRNADLIIVGRGRSQGLLSGVWSRLYPLICEAPCPVLSI